MQRTDDGLTPILDLLMEKRGFDFGGYHPAMLTRRIGNRLASTGCKNFTQYLSYLGADTGELDHLLDVITINVSRFFRDTLTFEFLADKILPAIVLKKNRDQDHCLRIWSAGCAMGEEPYSVAILVHELLRKEKLDMHLHLFATDIDANSLNNAAKAIYSVAGIENIKYRLLKKYFVRQQNQFCLVHKIRDQVTFSCYDMLDAKHSVPPESIFGNFDLVLCRNLLIYFNTRYQEMIFEKLHHALTPGGYLMLGEAESPGMAYQSYFSRVVNFCPIYQKK